MSTIPAENLLGGVSRQPDPVRIGNQLEESINLIPNISKGLTKRPGHTIGSQNLGTVSEDAFIHFFEDSEENEYALVIEGESGGSLPATPVRIYDLNETSVATLNYSDANLKYYFNGLGSVTSKDAFKVLTVADTTYIVNTTKQVLSGDTTVPYEASNGNTNIPCSVFVKTGKADSIYKITVNWVDQASVAKSVTVSVTTGTTTVTDRNPAQIATNLLAQLNLDANFAADITASAIDGVIHMLVTEAISPPPVDTKIEVRIDEDPVGNGNGIIAVNSTVQKFTDLPPAYIHDDIITVTGSDADDFNTYYVKFEGIDSSVSTIQDGKWVETAGTIGGLQVGVTTGNEVTLPLILIPDLTIDTATKGHPFDIAQELPDGSTYIDRLAGDSGSNPDPSFVGGYINDVFFYKNRLGFLAGENAILSGANNFLNFYATTVRDVLDSDPIDVAADSGGVSILKHAVPYDRNLIVFSKDKQFTLRGDASGLSPKTAGLNSVQSYESDILVPPVATAKAIMFASKVDAESSKVFEFLSIDVDLFDANDVTLHVPNYIDGNLEGMAAHATDRLLVGWSANSGTDNLATLYVNNFMWQGEQKVQNAWDKWELNPGSYDFDKILGAHFFKDKLVVLLHSSSSDTRPVEIINDDPRTDTGVDFRYHLDFRQDDSDFTFTPDGSNWKFTYEFGSETNLPKIYRLSASAPILTEIPIVSASNVAGGVEITTAENANFIVGMEPTYQWKPSKPVARDEQGKPVLHMLNNLKAIDWRTFHEATTLYTVTMSSLGRDDSVHNFNAAETVTSLYNEPPVSTDVEEVAVNSIYKDIDITIDSSNAFPATWVNQEWHISVNSNKG